MHLGDYELLVLKNLLFQAETMGGLAQAISSYPEDSREEGNVRKHLLAYISRFHTYADVQKATRQMIEQRGGDEYLESLADNMEFDESLYGWDN